MNLKTIVTPFVVGVSFFAGVAVAQQYMVGDRFLVDDRNPFVLDRQTGVWLYPWVWDVNDMSPACADAGLLQELGGRG